MTPRNSARAKSTPCAPNPSSHKSIHLSLEGSWEAANVVGKLTLVAQELNVGTINQDLSSSLLLRILLTAERGETPVLGNNDLLATWELVLGTTESLESGSTVCEMLALVP